MESPRVDTAATYLDWNATAPMDAAAIDAMTDAARRWGNPSSVHGEGRRAKAMLEAARRDVANALGVQPEAVIFTSGGTESLGLALNGAACGARIVSDVEHDAVLRQAAGAHICPVTADGVLDLEALERLLVEVEGPPLLALMHANNETGAIQPVEDAAVMVRAAGGRLLADCVQTAGKLRMPSADFIAVSAHKLGGPPGVGALVARCLDGLEAVQKGGGQERGYRAGTENLPGIAGFAAALAARAADRCWLDRVAGLRAAMESRLRDIAPDVVIAAAGVERLATTSAIRLPGVVASTQLIALDLAGIRVSSGAACSSGKVRASHVLSAMGWSAETASETIRVSMGWTTTEDDVARFIEAWAKLAARRGK